MRKTKSVYEAPQAEIVTIIPESDVLLVASAGGDLEQPGYQPWN